MIPSGPDHLTALAGLASLDEPVRRRLYEYVSGQDRPVSREEAAAATGITRTLAAYHLDKLADAGLLATTYQRPAGRAAGPGAGRPAKLYRQAGQELTVSVPPRAYELLAWLLAEAAESDTTGRVRSTLHKVARNLGRQVGAEAGDLAAALHGCGYQPRASAEGALELRNCPFHRLAQEHQELVCGLNLRLIQGVITGSAHPRARAVLSPSPGHCCVVVHGA